MLLTYTEVGSPSASSRESCQREFVVDAGKSMHIVSEKDLDSAELATMRTSSGPMTFQGHSGKAYSGIAPIDPALQDNVLLPKDFTKYVYHIGSGKVLKSIVNRAGRIFHCCESDGR